MMDVAKELLLFFFIFFAVLMASNAGDTITTARFLNDSETIVSEDGSFEMGFFSPGNSLNRYLGIWYKRIPVQTVVWVANRETPLARNASGVVKVIFPGVIVIVDSGSNNRTIWSSNTSSIRPSRDPIAKLLDSSNLVVKDVNENNPENFFWQSFDYPGDTLLPNMKLGRNFVTGREIHLSSWWSNEDPYPGDFTFQCEPTGYPQNVLRRRSFEIFRSGPWNGAGFSGIPSLRKNSVFKFEIVINKEEVFSRFELLNNSIILRLTVTPAGDILRLNWAESSQNWNILHTSPADNCDNFKFCGAYGICNADNSPICGCLEKFQPRNPQDWENSDWSNGCVRRTPLDCKMATGDWFFKLSGIKMPDTKKTWFNESLSLSECAEVCLKNCSCMAYSNLDVRGGGSGCLIWIDDLNDIRVVTNGVQEIFIRVASSELVSEGRSNRKKIATITLVLTLLVGLPLICLTSILFIRKRKKSHSNTQNRRASRDFNIDHTNQTQAEDLELPLFHLSRIVKATDNFSIDNKLGEGGFGHVYKGVLEDGREIAVKRLSKASRQGLVEFKNEVICISRHQHRNLVKLLGFCIEEEEDEMMLIYEYMPNKSLDLHIFDEKQGKALDWPQRFHIINGIARGLLYLHQDSRLRIIHRDLKASNILLDLELNPKISDFGLARGFGGNEMGANTSRVVGTYGYMSPEYVMEGIFSTKSDVFSFGVLVLEIVSGKRNRGFSHQEHQHNLVGHAWRLFNKDRASELIDRTVENSSLVSEEAVRSIHVALLCVQQSPEDRPNMASVVLMLGSKGSWSLPKQPGFFTERSIVEGEYSWSTRPTSSSINEITVTEMDPR